MEIPACPIQKFPDRSLITATPRQQMWCELRAQRPRLWVAVPLMWVSRHQPCNQSLDRTLCRAICLRPCSCHRLDETMHRHRRRGVLKGVVLYERNFGKRGERCQSLHFFCNGALDQCHWDTLGRALGQIRHERFRSLTTLRGLSNGEVKGRGDAIGVTYSTR